MSYLDYVLIGAFVLFVVVGIAIEMESKIVTDIIKKYF